mgnify:FL=1
MEASGGTHLDTGVSGRELYRIDLATPAAGSVLVRDIRAGTGLGSDPTELTAVGNLLYFSANDGAGPVLWKTDGLTVNTVKVEDTPGVFVRNPTNLTAIASGLIFSAEAGTGTGNAELWVSDGTQAGTLNLAEIFQGPQSSSPTNFHEAGGKV